MSQPVNSMPAAWCAARREEARAWRDANSQSTPGWQHVHELLSQLDSPPAGTQAAALAAAEAEIAMLLAEVVGGAKPSELTDATLTSDPGFYQFQRGMNAAKESFLRWARSKALDKGLAWPLPEAFFGYDHTNEDGTAGKYHQSVAPVAESREPEGEGEGGGNA